MAIGRTNVGGGEKIKSIIAVAYPAGSTCTCTDGTKTLTAKDTSGQAIFNVAPGTWTVTATNGSETDSQTVTVAEGQGVCVTLEYGFCLYDAGNEYIANTGGWEAKRYCQLTNTETALHAVPTTRYSANAGVFATVNKIDLTKYNTLQYHAKNNTAESTYLMLCIWSSIPASGEPSASAVAKVSFGANEEKEGAIDVSKLIGKYYVGGTVLWGDSVKGDGYLYSMMLGE